ncbi:hypothetical protein QPK87_11225 [Kamptonema cortianum]|nr:TIM barrel protein [Oscillatoria laete-virens]MDK3157146.1 hypothetical protein [Kamptonema cortianum]MDL5051123.1 hypothetical protein [Oscillatoria amoena NRMC-F 0135]MDL5055029.1 hypothetical protein [Oscillatoria laete-virens NRMC-F 0139]
MKRFEYSLNAWPYVHCQPAQSVEQIATRQIRLGFDAFDLLVGPDSFPYLDTAAETGRFTTIREAVESAGGRIASVILVGLHLSDEANCAEQFSAAPVLAGQLGTRTIHCLPRKIGITHDEGLKRFERLWKSHIRPLTHDGYTVAVENHTISDQADEDIFLARRTKDFGTLLEMSEGRLRLKFDPAWFAWGGEQSLEAFRKWIDHVEALDLKDFEPGKLFVTPGTGVLPFKEFAAAARDSSVRKISVEVEEHHFDGRRDADAAVVDELHRGALALYRKIFEAGGEA